MVSINPPSRATSLALAVAWAYPVALVAMFNLTWLIAWAVLGHPPRFSLDDPASISRGLTILYYFTVFLIALFPAAAIFGVFINAKVALTFRFPPTGALALLAGFVFLWAAAIFLLRSDPLGVIKWFMD